MERPKPFEITYGHDRRKHRHRCQACRCILTAGESVLMWRISSKVSRVLHIKCADTASFDGLTHREYAWLASDMYARKLGHVVPKHDWEIAHEERRSLEIKEELERERARWYR